MNRKKNTDHYKRCQNIGNLHQFDMGYNIIENTSLEGVAEMLRNVEDSGKRAVLMVFSNTCGQCTLIDKDFLRLAVKYPSYVFYREDVNRNLSPNITHLPTVRIIGPGGKFEDELHSADMIDLESLIRANMLRLVNLDEKKMNSGA